MEIAEPGKQLEVLDTTEYILFSYLHEVVKQPLFYGRIAFSAVGLFFVKHGKGGNDSLSRKQSIADKDGSQLRKRVANYKQVNSGKPFTSIKVGLSMKTYGTELKDNKIL